jgi:cytochrome bd ubiquinol oxidase subunit II
VILFMGFPTIFTTLMVSLHIPMLALLAGIVVRGTAFTFRHYDAVQEPKSQRVYTVLFSVSSLWTAVWLGIIVASLNRGIIDPAARDVWTAYVAPWWGLYPLSVGMFVACIFVFLACVYLIDETTDEALAKRFRGHAAVFNCLVIAAGATVFVTSLGERESLPVTFFKNPWTLGVMGVASLLFVALWFFITSHRVWLTRVVAAGQVGLILLGWWLLYAPNAMVTATGSLNFYQVAAPDATLRQLVWALLIGSCFIFPSLIFLLRVFKLKRKTEG